MSFACSERFAVETGEPQKIKPRPYAESFDKREEDEISYFYF